MTQPVDVVGQRFGRYLVIAKSEKRSKAMKQMVLCKCDCGKEFVISTTAIKQRKHLCCNDCLHKKRISSNLIRKTMWNRYIRGAKARNLEFSISIEYAEQLFYNQNGKCALSGVDISFEPYYKKNKTLTIEIDFNKYKCVQIKNEKTQ